jgi:LysM repeat protein
MKKQIRHNLKLITTLIVLLFPALLTAGEYTIKKTDTLWDISREKLGNPFLWPKLWEANPHIKNPHLIFPGQKLNMPAEVAKEEKELIEEKIITERPVAAMPVEKNAPRKVPIMKKEFLISRELFLQSGYITDNLDTTEIIGEISGAQQNKTLIGRGDIVYINSRATIKTGDKFYIISSPEKLIHPITAEDIGYLIRIKGVLKLIGEDRGYQKALILESYNEIIVNDMLISVYPVELPIETFAERRPILYGTVIMLSKNSNISGAGNIIYLDLGSSDGIKAGDIFDIVAGEKPAVTIGTVQIINTFNKTAVALVKNASQEIKVGDIIKN